MPLQAGEMQSVTVWLLGTMVRVVDWGINYDLSTAQL